MAGHVSNRAIQHILSVISEELQRGNNSVCMMFIGQRAGYRLRTAQYAIQELERGGALIVERQKPGQPCRYRLPGGRA